MNAADVGDSEAPDIDAQLQGERFTSAWRVRSSSPPDRVIKF